MSKNITPEAIVQQNVKVDLTNYLLKIIAIWMLITKLNMIITPTAILAHHKVGDELLCLCKKSYRLEHLQQALYPALYLKKWPV
jgi:hypothetical protein